MESIEVNEEMVVTLSVGGPPKFYVSETGVYLGSVSSAPDTPDVYEVPENWIEVPTAPVWADQIWLFPGWADSPIRLKAVEDAWRDAELVVIANQLLAIEEAAAAEEEGEEPPADLLPGTRNQWLSYRTKVRAWKTGNTDFPDMTKRPVRPA